MAKFEVTVGGVVTEGWTADIGSVIELIKRARGAESDGNVGAALTDLDLAEGLLLIVPANGGTAAAAKLIARLRTEWRASLAEAGDEIGYADCDLW